MHDKVKEFIERSENIRLASKRRQQEQHLIKLGLYEKDYAEDGKGSMEYPNLD